MNVKVRLYAKLRNLAQACIYKLDNLTGRMPYEFRIERSILGEITSQFAALAENTERLRQENSVETCNQIERLILGEVTSQFAALAESIERLRQENLVEVRNKNVIKREIKDSISDEVDRLDRYLVYHSDVLLDRIDRLQLAHRDREVSEVEVTYVAEDIDAILRYDGLELVIPSRETGLLMHMRKHGYGNVEPEVQNAIRRILKPGMCAIDAGANIGIHTVLMADAVTASGRVLAIEPIPHLARSVRQTLLLNGLLSQSTVHQVALGLDDSVGVLHVSEHSPVSSMYHLEDYPTDDLTVEVRKLDSLIEKGCTVNLVKIDVEGSESDVWQGMSRILNDSRSINVIMEWSRSHFERTKRSPVEFADSITAKGFSVWLLDASEPGVLKRLSNDSLSDLEAANVFMTRDGTYDNMDQFTLS